ncbi:uncharacterized protein LOC123037810 [Drosophila rhopaloa]|uniref:PHD-type domain-containing protein n=1 Tax=Drosophila rhopaloa TaxID=1041015 RepID=A0ABM5JBR3_DRORH|nr:uncharacterized protein LOC123037810 [Drosophila rhopaloa]
MSKEVCRICKKKAIGTEESWVQCDSCDSWYHFHCAGVGYDVEDTDWSCDLCLAGGSSENPPGRMMRSPPQNHFDISNSLSVNQNKPQLDALIEMDKPSGGQIIPDDNSNVNKSKLMLDMLEEKKASEQRFIEEKYKILLQMSMQDGSTDGLFQAIPASPSSSQIAARQAIPKELPSFSGDPEEWPMFISTFEHSTSAAGFSNVENMLRLQKCLKGRAREMVKDKLLLPSLVPEVMSTLKMFFGRPEHILERMIDKVRKLPPPKEKLESIIEYALAVRNICATIEACSLQAHLNNPMLVKELVDKLPSNHKLNWAMHPRDESVPPIKAFSDWLYKLAQAASTVVTPFSHRTSSVNTHNSCAASSSQGSTVQQQPNRKCIACESTNHWVTQCEQFKTSAVEQRWQVAKAGKACFRCLKVHRNNCRPKECGVNGCTRKHHPLLHSESVPNTTNEVGNQRHVSTHHGDVEGNQFFRIVPVTLHYADKKIEIFAFLDEGSSVTLIDSSIFDKLDIKGTPSPICLQWTGETTRFENTSVQASIQISGVSSETRYWLNNVHTVKNIALPKQTVDMDELRSKYSYLKDLPLETYSAQPMLLIGTNNWKIAVPRRIREGKWNDPIASKCMLGWTIQGSANSNRHVSMHHCDCNWQKLHEEVKEHFNLESISPKKLFSSEDKRAVEILDQTCQNKCGKYEVGLLWRNNIQRLPESRITALKRLQCMRTRILREPDLFTKIDDQIKNLLTKGYAKQLSDEEAEKEETRTWYLPIFIALNSNKPGKIRLVWDAAAKTNGICLNDLLLSGPDCLNPLIDVLLAFRVGKVAVSGDIAEMFHRINIRQEDMHSQRFLWYDTNQNKINTYVMRAMTFGISCAPFIAHYVRDKNALVHQQQFPLALDAIQRAHYVDDFIDSMSDEQKAIEISSQVREVHSRGGFEIRNWASNSSTVLSYLKNDGDAKKQEPVQFGATEKVLGMYWDPHKDVFKFICRFSRLKRDVLTDPAVPTKREVLQVLMSIFDPLGLLSCHTIGLKILLQKIWRANISWDQELPESLSEDWNQWKLLLPQVATINIPRCYSPRISAETRIDLHTFVDASEHAYSAACYLRVSQKDEVDVLLVAAKSKVAPLKPLSIPRMELQAAVMGSRLANKIVNVRNLRVDDLTFWSDSRTVLQWLVMDPRNFQQFVMHRIGEVLETTRVDQWRWIPSKLNVADGATKVIKNPCVDTWLYGPEFLKTEPSNWPTVPSRATEIDTTELRRHVFITRANKVLLDVEYLSDWRRLYRAVANMSLYIRRLQAKCQRTDMPTAVTEFDVKEAQTLLYKEAQRLEFADEIHSLSCKKTISAKSRLTGLNAYLDDNGILRTKGRVNAIGYTMDAIILPPESRATEKTLREELIKIDFDKIAIKFDGIKWLFNPPGAPHMGGAWERLVRTTKTVLKNICPNYSFNDESLRCALMEAQFIINSRPLTFVSLDSEDDSALTPNHLLMGSSNGYKPIKEEKINLRRHWNEVKLFGDRFWQRWVKEFTPVLTRRTKWFEKCPPISVGSVVIIIDENLPRNLWLKGRVINTFPAKDGQVRRATIKTQHGVLDRPATKIAVLDVGLEDGN